MTDILRRFEQRLPQEVVHGGTLAAKANPPQAAVGEQLMRNVEQGVRMGFLTVKREIMLGFLTFPKPLDPSGNVIVIVFLVKQRCHQ